MDANEIFIRPVDSGEADATASRLAELHLEAIRSGMALGHVEPVTVETLRHEWRRELEHLEGNGLVVLVAERAGRIVGMAQLVPSAAANAGHRAEVQRVAVAADERGRGIGKRLMAGVEATAAKRGLSLLYLTTHAETEACAFFEKCGYTQLGVMPDYSARPDGTLWPGAFYFRVLEDGATARPL